MSFQKKIIFFFLFKFSKIVQENDQSKAKIFFNLLFTINESYYILLFENFSKYASKLFGKSPTWLLLPFSVDKYVKQICKAF